MQTLVILIGLGFAAYGHALVHGWRAAVALWEGLDGRFPPVMQTPTPLAGPLLLACGAVCVLTPMTG